MRQTQKIKNWQYKPLLLIIGYIIFTLFLNLSGIIIFRDYKWWITLTYMLFVIGSIHIGYNHHRFLSQSEKADYSNPSSKTLHIIKTCILITLIAYILVFLRGLSTRGISVGDIYTRIIHTSDVYKDETVYHMGWYNYLIAFVGIFKTVAICGVVLYWKRLGTYRIYGLIAILLVAIYNMSFVGSIKELGDIIVFVSVSYIIKRDRDKPVNKTLLAIIIVAAVALFGFILYTRTLGYQYGLSRSVDKYYFKFNTNNLFYKWCSPSIAYSLTMLSTYLTQGYYGLSLSLQSPFTFTWGIGNSFTFAAYFNAYFGLDLRKYTYPFLAQEKFGYPALEFWSSMFPWLASDYTWVGAVIIIGLLARLYASLWDECNRSEDFFPGVFFAHLTIMWLYLPCNNQIMQTLQSTLTTIILFIIYFCRRKHIKIVIKSRGK